MKKAYIIHENSDWIGPLINYLNSLNIPYEDWHMDKVCINTSALNNPVVFEYKFPLPQLMNVQVNP